MRSDGKFVCITSTVYVFYFAVKKRNFLHRCGTIFVIRIGCRYPVPVYNNVGEYDGKRYSKAAVWFFIVKLKA